jgi:hypothetical protein
LFNFRLFLEAQWRKKPLSDLWEDALFRDDDGRKRVKKGLARMIVGEYDW